MDFGIVKDIELNKVDGVSERIELIERAFDDGLIKNPYHDVKSAVRVLDGREVDKLEILGSKILSAKDVQSSRKLEHRFWIDEEDFNKYAESKNTINESSLNILEDDSNVFDYISNIDVNTNKQQQTVCIDSETDYDGAMSNIDEGLSYYRSEGFEMSIIDKINKIPPNERTKKMNYILNNTSRYVQSLIRESERMKSDIYKERKSIVRNHTKKEKSYEDEVDVFSKIDIYDEKHVKALIVNLADKDENGSLYERTLSDLFNIIMKSNEFTQSQKDVCKGLSVESNGNQSVIAEGLGVSRKIIYKRVISIAKKIIKLELIENILVKQGYFKGR